MMDSMNDRVRSAVAAIEDQKMAASGQRQPAVHSARYIDGLEAVRIRLDSLRDGNGGFQAEGLLLLVGMLHRIRNGSRVTDPDLSDGITDGLGILLDALAD